MALSTAYRLTASIGNLLCRTISPSVMQTRTKITFSMGQGKGMTEREIINRFYRLDWGMWIRPRSGRTKKIWRRTGAKNHVLRQHVFCNRQQSGLHDKMVESYWKRKKYYPDDPYEVYQTRPSFTKYFPDKPRFLP